MDWNAAYPYMTFAFTGMCVLRFLISDSGRESATYYCLSVQ